MAIPIKFICYTNILLSSATIQLIIINMLSRNIAPPNSSTRRSQRRKNKHKFKTQPEYSIPNPFKTHNTFYDLPSQLSKELLKFEKLSMRSLQKINFAVMQQRIIEKMPTYSQFNLENKSSSILSKMRCAAKKQQKKYNDLNAIMEEYAIFESPNQEKEYTRPKQNHGNQENDADELEFQLSQDKFNQHYSQELNNLLHDNYQQNNHFLLYSGNNNFNDHPLARGFLKDDFDHYLI